jgi:hypothetical protein
LLDMLIRGTCWTCYQGHLLDMLKVAWCLFCKKVFAIINKAL